MSQIRLAIAWRAIIIVIVLASSWSAAFISERETRRASVHSCERDVQERLAILTENELAIAGNKAVSEDPKQPLRTRVTRKRQYEGEQHLEKERRERVDPAHGGKLVCTEVFPAPSLTPTPW